MKMPRFSMLRSHAPRCFASRGCTPRCCAGGGGSVRRASVHRRAGGLTLMELVLALAGTVLIGTTVAAMLYAVAYGSESGTDLRDLIPRQRVLAGRIGDALRTSLQVMEVQSDGLVVWYDDLNGNGTSDSNELMWLMYDPVGGDLVMAKAVAGAAGTAVTTASDFETVRLTLSGAGELQQETWARGLPAFEFSADAPVPGARMVWFRVTTTSGGLSETQVHAAAIAGLPS